jgi:hypothetical protein
VVGGAGGIRGVRAEEKREGKDDRDSGETIELSGRIKRSRDLVSDLLGG